MSLSLSLSPPPGLVLADTHFDCLLLGTSLANTLLAAALARLGKKVLHVDRNDYYGALDTSLAFNDFAQLVHSHSRPQPAAAGHAEHSAEQVSDWRAVCGDSHSQLLSFHAIPHSSPLYAASSATFSPVPAAADNQSDDSDGATPAAAALLLDSSAPAVSPPLSPLSLPSSQSRLYSLDVTPRLLLSRCGLVELLIASSTSAYVEFRAVDHSYLCPDERSGLQQVPVSRSAVFNSTLISMAEKRQLMRLLAAVLPNHKVTAQQADEDSKEIAQWSERPFADWLLHRNLSPRLLSFVAYAIALLDYRQDAAATGAAASSSSSPFTAAPPPVGSVTAAAGIGRMRRHLQSIGRYSPGAFLYPIYGLGELPQAFARLCAVHGGTYILRYQPVCVVSEATDDGQRRAKGIVSNGRQLITADALVCDREYVDDDGDSDASSVSCAVCVVDGRVLGAAGEPLDELVQCVFPPLSVQDNQHAVRVVQLGGSVKAAPDGRCVLHLFTPSTASTLSAADELQPVVDYLTAAQRPTAQQHSGTGPDSAAASKPRLLHAFFYKRKQRPSVAPAAPPTASFRSFRNVLVSGDSSPLSPLDSAVEAAQLLLSRVVPGAELLAALTCERPDAASGDDEKQQLDQLNILNSVIGSDSSSSTGEHDDGTDADAEDRESKEQTSSAASPHIRTIASEQQEQDQDLSEEQKQSARPTDRAVPSPAMDEDAVMDSLDDLTFG